MVKTIKIAGVLIEPRKLINIFYSVRNFYSVFPLNTALYFFHGNHLSNKFILAVHNMIPNSNVKCISLDVSNLKSNEYSDFMKNPKTWEYFTCDYILTIQTDGCLCINSPYKIQNFLKYDYVGGYGKYNNWWRETKKLLPKNIHQCFNGGFSLRNVAACKSVLQQFPPLPSKKYNSKLHFREYAEDLYFVLGMLYLNYKVGVDKFAINFCSHTTYRIGTFCVHNTIKYEKNPIKLKIFLKYCPHYKYFLKLVHAD